MGKLFFSITVPHCLAQEEVKGIISSCFDDAKEFVPKSFMVQSWRDYACTFSIEAMGIAIEGNLTVGTDEAELNLSIPETFSFRKIKKEVEFFIKKYLECILESGLLKDETNNVAPVAKYLR